MAAVVLTAGVITTWLLIIADHAAPGTSRTSAQLDAVRTGLAAGGGAGAAVGLMLAFRRQYHQEAATADTNFDAAERRITELYTKAVEQLGHDKAPVRLGGLYALERLAQDNEIHRQTIVNVICAYLRMPFPAVPDGQENDMAIGDTWQQEKQVRLTAQRILYEHLRRLNQQYAADFAPLSGFWKNITLDLTGATLINFHLYLCTVAEAQFAGANFINVAGFTGITFSRGAKFDGAIFKDEAWFDGAEFGDPGGLGGAAFSQATFERAAQFSVAKFGGEANFVKAAFGSEVNFVGATFGADAGFDRATFGSEAKFSGATFSGSAIFDYATFSGNAVLTRLNSMASPKWNASCEGSA
jgi:uncharacterized protein YjbI with pentapeptide repeats